MLTSGTSRDAHASGVPFTGYQSTPLPTVAFGLRWGTGVPHSGPTVPRLRYSTSIPYSHLGEAAPGCRWAITPSSDATPHAPLRMVPITRRT
jgi:hypothetical protein